MLIHCTKCKGTACVRKDMDVNEHERLSTY